MTTDKAAPRVAVDAMGGDHGPGVVVEGAVLACRELGLRAALVGPQDAVQAELLRRGGESLPIEVVDAPDVVGMGEKVSLSTLKKRSSIQVALERVRDGAADAFFSAGNTAACWTIAKMVLGTLEEVDRPALAAVVPHLTGRTVLLDVGANAQCKARHLEEFAVMGSVYTRDVFGTPNPRVGLMSMGEEETKGNELTKEVHEVLKDSSLNFIGNVEGHDLFTGKVDVIVMDGFTGNVVLKASETLAESIVELLREELGRSHADQGRGLALHARLPGGAAAHRPLGIRRGPAPRREGLLRHRPRAVERPGHQARHPRGRGRSSRAG